MSRWIAIELAALAAITLFACVQATPPQGNGSTMASSDGRAAGNPGGGAAGADCESVCTHLVECKIDGVPDDGTCPQQCRDGGYDQATIARFQSASCQAIRDFIANPPKQPQGGGGGGGGGRGGSGYHMCSAAGVYEVCDGSFCRDHDADSTGDGDSLQAAQSDAVRACNHHMNTLVLSNQMNYRSSVKQSCQVTGCK